MPVDISQLPEWHTKRVLAERQDRYIEGRVNGMTAKEAAETAGYPQSTARKPFKLIETPELRRRMQKAMLNRGGLRKIADTVSNALEANVTASFEGSVSESNVPDHKVRVQAAKLAADLMGITERNPGGAASTQIVINMPASVVDRYAPKVIEG